MLWQHCKCIYRVKEYPDQVIKIIRETHILQNEIKIMNILKGTPNIIQLGKHSTNYLSFTLSTVYRFSYFQRINKFSPQTTSYNYRCFHEKGVLHRDCHPSNILYYMDKSNELKFMLSDFGYS